MARPTTFSTDSKRWPVLRTISGVIAAGNSTLSDANYPAASGFSCEAYQTIWVGVEIDGGTNPTATLEFLVRDAEAADGARWKRLYVGASPAAQVTPALVPGQLVELVVAGRVVIPRVTAVTNGTNTTALRVIAFPGARSFRGG